MTNLQDRKVALEQEIFQLDRLKVRRDGMKEDHPDYAKLDETIHEIAQWCTREQLAIDLAEEDE
jgi:hypothetical protein